MVESRKRKSLLGALALLGGIASLLITHFHLAGARTVTIHSVMLPLGMALAVGAAAVALVALAGAAASPRTGTGLPIAAVVVCAAAVVLAFKPNLWSSRGATSTAQPTTPKAANAPASSPPGARQTNSNVPPRVKTIFDSDFPSSTPPPAPRFDSPNSGATGAPSHASRSEHPAPVSPAAAMQAARDKLDAARANVMRTLETSDEYRQAKSDADAADSDLKTARQMYETGSYKLLAADKAAIAAHKKVQKLVDDATSRDPACQDAERQLRSAQAGAASGRTMR
jgi:hypothetical protein